MIKTWSMPVLALEKETVSCIICGKNVFIPSLICDGYFFSRCKSCGLIQMNPQPVKEEVHKRYSVTFGKDYLQYELDNEKNFLNLQLLGLKDAGFSFELSASPKDEASRVPSFLDIGCAAGALLQHLKGLGWKVTGVEISPGAEYAVKERNLDVRSIPLEENKFESKSFDVIHASHLIEHLNNPLSFLEEARRILKDDGCLYITTPNIAGFQAKLFGKRWRSAIFDHLYLFSKRSLKKLLKKTGFKVIRIKTWGGLAAGTSPVWVKKIVDSLAKIFGFGDVMIVKAKIVVSS